MNDDVQAIKNILFSYAEMFDAGDFDGAVELFTHAAVTVSGSGFEARGPAVRALLTAMVRCYGGVPCTKHVVANVVVDVEPDGRTASTRSYYVALQARPELPLQPILAGRWHDQLEKVDGRWRLTTRVIHSDLVGNISYHLDGPS